MTWDTLSVRLRKTSSGKIDSRYPQGVLPGTPLTWSTIPDQTAVEGQTVSLDVRSYLSGTNNSTATITVDGTLPSGWSLSTSTLSYSGTGTGTASIRLLANSTTASLYFGVESVAAQAGDTVAPTVPPQISATVSGVNVTVEFDQSMDPHDGTTPGSLIQKYDLYRNDSLVIGMTGLGNGVSTAVPPTQGDIGSPTAPGSSSQSIYDWSLTSRGDLASAVDAFRFVRMPLPSPHVVTAKVTSITGFTSDFAKAGVMVRASTAADSAFVSAQVRQGGSLRIEYRAATGGSRKTIGTATLPARMDAITPPYVWLQLRPTGDLWTAYYSEDGTTWNTLESISVSLPPDSLHGIFTCATNADNAVTSTFEDFAIAPVTKGTYTHAPGAVSTYKVRAVDNANNASGFGHTVTVTPDVVVPPPPLVQTRNWNPGHYIRPGPKLPTSNWESYYKNYIDIAAANPFKGLQIISEWKSLEIGTYSSANSTAVRYAPGFAKIDNLLDYAIGKNMQLSLNIWWNNFGGGLTSTTSPNYINTTPGYGADYLRYPTYGANVRAWNNATMDRFIEMAAAYMERYRNESNFEFFKVPGETALGGTARSQSDYNGALVTANIKRLVDTLAPLSRKAWFSFGGNWMDVNEAAILALIQTCVTNGCGIGSTDPAGYARAFVESWVPTWATVVQHATDFDQVSFGYDKNGALAGTPDYRGVIPHSVNVEGGIYDGSKGSSIQQLYASGMFYCSHMSWHPESGKPNATIGQIISMLAADDFALNYTAYPTAFPRTA